jgi:hypothetical protein
VSDRESAAKTLADLRNRFNTSTMTSSGFVIRSLASLSFDYRFA